MLGRTAATAAAAQLCLLACCGGAAASAACPGDGRTPTAASAGDAAAALLCDLNSYRARENLAPLHDNARLRNSAQDLASDMAQHQFFSHTSSDGRTLVDRAKAGGYVAPGVAWLVRENIGWGSLALATPAATALGWMRSDLHRANLLDPEVEDVGIAVGFGSATAGGVSGVFYVADFGARHVTTAARSTRTRTRTRRCRARSKRSVRRSRRNACRARHGSRP
jgi:uncharacterized protein YkwD